MSSFVYLYLSLLYFLTILGLGVVGFCMCTLPRIHYHVLLASTAAVGASAFVLGIDCFTTANLKEVRIFLDKRINLRGFSSDGVHSSFMCGILDSTRCSRNSRQMASSFRYHR